MKDSSIKYAIIAALVLLAGVFLVSWWLERNPEQSGDQRVAAERTAGAVVVAQKAETVLVRAKARAAAAETVYVDTLAGAARAAALFVISRANALANLADTVKTKQALINATTALAAKDGALRQATTTIAEKNVAIAQADTAIAKEKEVTASVRDELAIALRPKRVPRFAASAAALYDPIAQAPAASVGGGFRVIGRLSLVARGDMRFEPGGKPVGYLGASVTF